MLVLLLITAELHPSVWQQLRVKPLPRKVYLFSSQSLDLVHFFSTAENPISLKVALTHLKIF